MHLLESEDSSTKTASSDGWYGSHLIITLVSSLGSRRVLGGGRIGCASAQTAVRIYRGVRAGGEVVRRNMQACRRVSAVCLPLSAAANAAFMSVPFCSRTAAAALTSVPSPQCDQFRPQNVTVKRKGVTSFCAKHPLLL